ncbi:hypothetical protein [Actinomadura sp. 9N407]|uniref:hypothetical protein n=1 Tax=Actinomadura sp. 9N407 TaxID=3375154 RepID=UPI0037B85427
MKTRSRTGRQGSPWGRIAGYGGAVLLVAAAVAVLLYPVLDRQGNGAATAGGRTTTGPQTGGPAVAGPGDPAASGAPGSAGPDPRQSPSAPAQGQGGGQGGGPPMPGQGGGGTVTWCPNGTAFYRAEGTTLQVVIQVSASGFVRAEVSLNGRAPLSKQGSAKAGRPHTLTFPGVPAELVERVKVTTVSVGASMQTCYARIGA